MADSELTKELKEAAKKAQEDSAKLQSSLQELLKTSEKPADRVKLLKMQSELRKGQQSLSGDLGKNITDMKEGFATSINGMINQTFGPLGGMVTSLTTGFFKRGKENRDNLEQNKLQNENAQEMIEKLGGIREAVESTDGKIPAIDKDIDSSTAANGGLLASAGEDSGGGGLMATLLTLLVGGLGAFSVGLADGYGL